MIFELTRPSHRESTHDLKKCYKCNHGVCIYQGVYRLQLLQLIDRSPHDVMIPLLPESFSYVVSFVILLISEEFKYLNKKKNSIHVGNGLLPTDFIKEAKKKKKESSTSITLLQEPITRNGLLVASLAIYQPTFSLLMTNVNYFR
jgi:hypothetical protein